MNTMINVVALGLRRAAFESAIVIVRVGCETECGCVGVAKSPLQLVCGGVQVYQGKADGRGILRCWGV